MNFIKKIKEAICEILDKNKELFRQYKEIFEISAITLLAGYYAAFLYRLGLAAEIWPWTLFSSVMGVLGIVLIMLLIAGIMLSIIGEKGRIKRPPFRLAYDITEDFFSEKFHKSKIVPLIDEYRNECLEAYRQNKEQKITWIKVRFYLALPRRIIKNLTPFLK